VEGAHVVAEMKFAGGAHATEDALTAGRNGVRHGILHEGNGFGYCNGSLVNQIGLKWHGLSNVFSLS
jgi:hypothetical protein